MGMYGTSTQMIPRMKPARAKVARATRAAQLELLEAEAPHGREAVLLGNHGHFLTRAPGSGPQAAAQAEQGEDHDGGGSGTGLRAPARGGRLDGNLGEVGQLQRVPGLG